MTTIGRRNAGCGPEDLTELLETNDATVSLRQVIEEGTAIVPVGRPADPADVAAAVAFLAGATADSSLAKRFTLTAAAAAWADSRAVYSKPKPRPLLS